MKRAVFFAVVAVLLLVPWAVAYAYDEVKAADIDATIVPADPASTPTMNVFGNYIGCVTAGDLFMVDVSGTTGNTTFTLYMTNIDELVHSYRFMILKIGIYVQTEVNGWEKMATIDGGPIPEMYITMQNGLVSFTLPGNAKYKVTLEKGSYRSYSFTGGENIAIPQFCLNAS